MGQQVQCTVGVEFDVTENPTKSMKRLTTLLRERFERLVPRATVRVQVGVGLEDSLTLQPPHRGTLYGLDTILSRTVDAREDWCVPAAGAKTPRIEEDEDADDPILEDVG